MFCVLPLFAQQSNDSKKSENKTQKTEKEQDEAKDCPEYGVVRLKITFDKSGIVTKAKIVSSAGCSYFDDKALEAAKSIKFEPAKKNGKKITQVKTVEYTFERY